MNKLTSTFDFRTHYDENKYVTVELSINYKLGTYSVFPKYGTSFEFVDGKPTSAKWSAVLTSINEAVLYAESELCI
jgi:hypothetical protein